MNTVFIRVIENDDKAAALLAAIRAPGPARKNQQRFEVKAESFSNVPRSPFAYWVSDRVRGIFSKFPSFSADGGVVRQGMATADDFRFVRAWWAVKQHTNQSRWFPFAKGGAFSPFYATLDLVANWGTNGEELKAWADPLYNNSGWSRIIKSTDYYFRPGLTWPLRTHRFCPQILPAGVVISVRGSGIYSTDPELFLGLFSSRVVDRLMRMLSGQDARPQFDMGDVASLPSPNLAAADRDQFALLARRAWSLSRFLDSHVETSHAFALPALLRMNGESLDERVAAWATVVCSTRSELAVIQAEIDELGFHVYGIDEDDRRAVLEGFGGVDALTDDDGKSEDVDADDNGSEDAEADACGLASDLVSWAVGIAFGRFDVRLAQDPHPTSEDPDPFERLPACSPGMLADAEGMLLARPPADYPLAIPETAVLVDDPGHALDLTKAVRRVVDMCFDSGDDRWWNGVAALLDPKGHDLRAWLAVHFFEHHLKRYSKSRRKAPILWQLGTSSGRYSVWLYAHRLTGDTFFQLQNDVVGPKLVHEEGALTRLTLGASGSPSAGQRKEIAAQEAFVEELRAMLDEVKRVAPLWNPNLDDGVVLTMAPLWRLVPQHKPWQRELKSRWDELAAGKYDWAQVAMQLWPERVVPKCATDRSLAIAHDLEDQLWVAGADGKWKPRATLLKPVEELVRERTSPAVKSALRNLLDAPCVGGSRKRGSKDTTDIVMRNEP